MDVEKVNIQLLPYFLNKVDKDKQGVALDIGVGTFNFFFFLFANLGYHTIAVEPLPSDELITLCKQQNIILEKSVLGKVDGYTTIYTGVFQGNDLTDVSSTSPSWWGVNDNSKEMKVPSISLCTLLAKYDINQISYMKVDVEGSELSILDQIPSLNLYKLPQLIEFEYGGGGCKIDKIGGWSDPFFSNTIEILKTLGEIGYQFGMIVEREEPQVKCFSNGTNVHNIFESHYVYGNILLAKSDIFNCENISKFISRSKSVNFVKRTMNKILK